MSHFLQQHKDECLPMTATENRLHFLYFLIRLSEWQSVFFQPLRDPLPELILRKFQSHNCPSLHPFRWLRLPYSALPCLHTCCFGTKNCQAHWPVSHLPYTRLW